MRRLVLVVVVAGLWAGAGSALLAPSAFAGGINTDNGNYVAAVYNVTPYPWTLVAAATPELGICSPNPTCWSQSPAQTIPAGGGTLYGLNPNYSGGGGITFSDKFGYDGWMTYRVDVLGGPPEYVTVALSQLFSNGVFGNNIPALRQFITSAPPPASYDPGPSPDAAPAPLTASPQLTYAAFQPTSWDLTYTLTGNYTVDASTDLGAPFVQLLNSVCGANPSACSFTQTEPMYWGIGTPYKVGSAPNCTVTGKSQPAPSAGAVGGEPPPLDPNWQEVEYEAKQSASLTVGGGVTVGTEFNLFDSISGKISVKIEAEHEWQETKTFARSSKVYVPSNEIGEIWMAPTVAKVTGTLVLTVGSATFTATNFSEERSGVSRGDETPAFTVITRIRPMTSGELKTFCGSSDSASLGSPGAKPPAALVPGRGVDQVAVGQTMAQVAGALGQPSVRLFSQNGCRGLDPGCDAVAGVAGTWVYRQVSVVFAAGGRVSAIIYRGPELSARGVGVGSPLPALRRAYPGVSCTTKAKQRYCTLRGVAAGHAVKTVFVFMAIGAGRYKCNSVLIYVIDTRDGRVSA